MVLPLHGQRRPRQVAFLDSPSARDSLTPERVAEIFAERQQWNLDSQEYPADEILESKCKEGLRVISEQLLEQQEGCLCRR
jgi:hypothetical protein